MEKMKMTRKNLTGKPVIKIGYCGAYYLLKDLQPVGYMAGVYGWNCDVYDAGAAWIVTGYRFYGIRGKHANYELLQHAENIARRAYSASWLTPEVVIDTIVRIRAEFIDYCLNSAAL